MSSAKSRNFRRRAGDDDDDDEERNSATPPTTTTASVKLKSTPSTSIKPQSSTAAKPKKSASQPPTKSLLSFADDEDSPEPQFPRPASKPPISNSRLSNKSSHKLTSSKDRIAPHSTTSSNLQPEAGIYTKEALLELQKNTKTLGARSKPKPEPEPVIVLKGLVKPNSASASNGESSSVERDDALSRLGKFGINSSLSEDNKEAIPDQEMINAIRAKRERLRQAKAAAPDYIALDGGSNHGEAEGLSDEEPEFQSRIGFFTDKVNGDDKKGVFEEFEERVTRKEKRMEIQSDDDEEDEEDKLWEEEQVRKGLGKRLDESVTTHQSSNLPANFASAPIYPPVQNMGYSGTNGESVGGIFGTDVVSISQQAELTMKALNENFRRVKESHGRTVVSLEKTEENLTSSLLNISALESSFSAADEKYIFLQKLREFVSLICEFLQDKAHLIEELEEHMQKLHEERARNTAERRASDNKDEIFEIEQAITAARAEFRKSGNSTSKLASATAAAQAALANTRAHKNAPVELDEYGRDVNLQKRMDIMRRAEAREKRRIRADSKRKLAMDNNKSYQQMEGESSTDESENESTAYESTRNELLLVTGDIFSDWDEEYSKFSIVIERFETWKKNYTSSYRDAFMSMSLPAVFSPYVRRELLKWDPLHEEADFLDMEWHSLLFNYGLPEDDDKMNTHNDTEGDTDANLIPQLVEKLAIPILHHRLDCCWDTLSTCETKFAVSAVNLVVRYVNLSSSGLVELFAVLHNRLSNAVADVMVPTWSPLEMKAVSNAARVAAYRFGASVRLMRNICMWNKILAKPILEKIALDELLCGKILPHLHSIYSNVHDAIIRTERVIASLDGVWAGQGVSGERSRKLQPLVDYLLLLGKTLEKKHVSSDMETETGKLVRRLKKMLVELNEYDHARVLSRTFNLKEAL